MSENLYTHADSNVRRTWAFMVLFFIVVVGLGWFISYWYQNETILVTFILFAVFMNFFSYWYSDKIVLGLHHAHPITRADHFELWNIVENLSITAGLPMPTVYIVDDPAPNAFATGRDKEHAVVCVTSGLLPLLNKDELEGVIAHELSHIGNKDILLSTVIVVLAGFVTLLSHFFLRGMMFGGRRNDREGNANAIFLAIGIIFAILSPLIALLIQLAISRRRELLADADGALLTRYPEGLASALQKISDYSRPMRTASNADAHLFITNPFGKPGQLGTLQKLFLTHPPVAERVQALLGRSSVDNK